MARVRGKKRWDAITYEGWLSLFADTTVMSDLMMQIFACLYHSPNYTDNAKHIADTLRLEYRSLNAAVGWAGNKIKDMWMAGALPVKEDFRYQEKTKEEIKAEETLENGLIPETAGETLMAPWQYVFDGEEDDFGVYLWILKPEAALAMAELSAADTSEREAVRLALAKDISASGKEGNLFSASSEETVEAVRTIFDEKEKFVRKSLGDHPRCCVCGIDRISLLTAVPYGYGDLKPKGLVLCPTHAALFAAKLITFSDRGKLLISSRLTEEEAERLGLKKGADALTDFSRRRMAVHRREFNEEARKDK